MTKGHNQGPGKQQTAEGKGKDVDKQNSHLSDKQKNKSPNQGRNKDEDPSGGTKGQNAI